MKTAWLFLIIIFPLAARAEGPTCSPTYQIHFKSCVRPNSPVQVKTVLSDWILVNKGAKVVTPELCEEAAGQVASQNPKASNVRFAGGRENIKTEDSLNRNVLSGVGRVDVYCRFQMSIPVPQAIESADCGVQTIERQGCSNNLSLDFVKTCIASPGSTDRELWTKAACLLDSFREAPRVQGMTRDIYHQITFQLQMMEKSLSHSKSQAEQQIASYIEAQMRKK